jgi:hypothetical protein
MSIFSDAPNARLFFELLLDYLAIYAFYAIIIIYSHKLLITDCRVILISQRSNINFFHLF